MKHLTNIRLQDYCRFLARAGCKMIRTHGGHEIWSRSDLPRPIVVQSHVDPVPAFIVHHGLRQLHVDREVFLQMLEE